MQQLRSKSSELPAPVIPEVWPVVAKALGTYARMQLERTTTPRIRADRPGFIPQLYDGLGVQAGVRHPEQKEASPEEAGSSRGSKCGTENDSCEQLVGEHLCKAQSTAPDDAQFNMDFWRLPVPSISSCDTDSNSR